MQDFIIQARFSAYSFLAEIIEGTDRLLKEDPNRQFYFPRHIKRNDENSRCISGWMVDLFPKLIVFEGEFIRTRSKPRTSFQPGHIGIPISYTLWSALTVHGTQENIGEPALARMSDYDTVITLWKKVAEKVRLGELDQYIMSEAETDRLFNI